MNPDLQDDLDRTIDEALRSAVAGEPRRVGAASVRAAIAERSRSPLPAWLGLAAALVVGGGVAFLKLAAEPGAPPIGSRPGDSGGLSQTSVAIAAPSPSPALEVAAGIDPTRLAFAPGTTGRSVGDRLEPNVVMTTEPPYEGFAPLVIAPLSPPESISPLELGDHRLSITALETAPLTLAGLANETEQ